MAITKERFEQGISWDEYLAQNKINKSWWESIYNNAEIPPDVLTFFKGLSEPLNLLTISEDWCSDARAYVPYVAKLANSVPDKLNHKVFLRDQNADIVEQYLLNGKYKSIPVFAFFDQEMNQIAAWIERPAHVSEFTRRKREEYGREHPELEGWLNEPGEMPEETRRVYREFSRELHSHYGPEWAKTALREIRDRLAQGLWARVAAG